MAQIAATDPASASLPLLTLYLTDRCNSRCVTCDYWRHGRTNLTLAAIRQLLPSLEALKTRTVVLSGGEPLLNPEWAEIAALLRAHGLKLWLLTSGLSLAKHAASASALFDSITVSLDGTRAETYAAIRGLNAFEVVCAGIRAAAAAGAPVGIRVTLQRANYRELGAFADLAHEIGARQVSFLAVDVANPHAFGRTTPVLPDAALAEEDLAAFEGLLHAFERDRAEDFRSGFIAESPAKLRRILAYFAAVRGYGRYPGVQCNAPEFSAVVEADGRVRPCFFIPGPAEAPVGTDVAGALNAGDMRELRASIRAGTRPECTACVCPLWRNLDAPGPLRLAPRIAPAAGVADAHTR